VGANNLVKVAKIKNTYAYLVLKILFITKIIAHRSVPVKHMQLVSYAIIVQLVASIVHQQHVFPANKIIQFLKVNVIKIVKILDQHIYK
jgi:hypothetical protein